MSSRDFGYYKRLARDLEKVRLPPDVQEGLRQRAKFARALGDDPSIRAVIENSGRIAAERRALARNIPNAATRKAISDAARFFESDYFRSQSEALARTVGLAGSRLGPQGLGSAGRVAGRRAPESPAADEAAERLEAGDAEALLEEATELAASPEVRDLIERADLEALVRLDEQQAAEAEAGGNEPRAEQAPEADRLAELWDRRPTREQLGELLDGALLVMIPLEAALASAAMLNPSSELAVQLAVAYLVVTAIITTARLLLTMIDDEKD